MEPQTSEFTSEKREGNLAPVTKGDFEKFTKEFYYILTAIVVVLVVAFVTLLVTVASMVMDQFRFNAVVYSEYIERDNETNALLQSSIFLMEEIVSSGQNNNVTPPIVVP